VADGAAAPGAAAPRTKSHGSRFPTYRPAAYLDLPRLWKFRKSQSESLRKLELEYPTASEERKAALSDNILKYKRTLNQLDVHQQDAHKSLQLLIDLAKVQSLEVGSSECVRHATSQLSKSFGSAADAGKKGEEQL
jgi:hypothetical protein